MFFLKIRSTCHGYSEYIIAHMDKQSKLLFGFISFISNTISRAHTLSVKICLYRKEGYY